MDFANDRTSFSLSPCFLAGGAFHPFFFPRLSTPPETPLFSHMCVSADFLRGIGFFAMGTHQRVPIFSLCPPCKALFVSLSFSTVVSSEDDDFPSWRYFFLERDSKLLSNSNRLAPFFRKGSAICDFLTLAVYDLSTPLCSVVLLKRPLNISLSLTVYGTPRLPYNAGPLFLRLLLILEFPFL